MPRAHLDLLRSLLSAAAVAGALACNQPPAPETESVPAAGAGAEPAREAEAPPERTPSSDTCAPIEALAQMDHRSPLPLQPMMAWHQKQNMMEHLVAIQRITQGLADEDWAEIADAAALIESSPQMKNMCEHMGAGADGFTQLALSFHEQADEIAPAAEAQDAKAVLSATSKTLKTCTSCHAAYRQEVVDADTWQARTGSEHDPAAMHHGE